MFKPKLLLAITLIASISTVFGADACSTTIRGSDMITFTDAKNKPVPNILIPASCSNFTINLIHSGKMPKTAMGHNVVIVKASDISSVVKDGMKFGIRRDYLKPKDSRIIAASKMIGGGEKTSVSFPVANIKNDDYLFFCSFVGHDRKMRGKLVIQK